MLSLTNKYKPSYYEACKDGIKHSIGYSISLFSLWYYRDSYSGFFQSWGQSVVYYKNKPFWTELYGGGMKKKYHNNYEFSNHTFGFLKGALSAGAKMNSFNPRGPKSYKEGELEYLCMWKGNIKKFNGNEKILYKGNVVFTHDFVGGLILSPS